jgi:hypothetical protein
MTSIALYKLFLRTPGGHLYLFPHQMCFFSKFLQNDYRIITFFNCIFALIL